MDTVTLGRRILLLLNDNNFWVSRDDLAEQFGATPTEIRGAVDYVKHQDWVEEKSQGVGMEFSVRITERGKEATGRNTR